MSPTIPKSCELQNGRKSKLYLSYTQDLGHVLLLVLHHYLSFMWDHDPSKTWALGFSFPVSVSNVQLWVYCCIIKVLTYRGLISEVSTQIIFTSLAWKEESELFASCTACFSLYMPERLHVLPTLTFNCRFWAITWFSVREEHYNIGNQTPIGRPNIWRLFDGDAYCFCRQRHLLSVLSQYRNWAPFCKGEASPFLDTIGLSVVY